MRCLSIAFVMTVAVAALAQTPQDGSQPRRGFGPPSGQDGGPRRMWGGPGGGMPWGMRDPVPDRLELDEAQRTRYDELMAGHFERMRIGGERWQEAMRAEQAGDPAPLERLRNEARERDFMTESLNQVYDEFGESLSEEQLDQLDEMRDNMERGMQRMRAAWRMREELPEKLNLDETQKQQFDEMLQARREQMRQGFEQMRPVWEELRTARENGDDARAAEIEKQLEASRPDFDALTNEFLDQVATILTAEQTPLMAEYREQFSAAPAAAAKSGVPDVRTLLKAMRRVKLSSEQRGEVRELEGQAMRESRGLSAKDTEAQAKLAKETKSKLLALLDAGQRKDFEAAIRRAGGGEKGR